MAAPSPFSEKFQSYLIQARTAQSENRHHDYRRQIFLAFLDTAFGIKADEIDVEKYLRIDLRRKGWIDALFRDLVIEFKRNFENERADGLRELRDYLKTLDYGNESVGLLTDGLIFEVYTLDESGRELRPAPVDQIDLGKVDDETAFLWLDSYLFSQKGVPPTSADIVRRFGAHSPTFQMAARTLHDLLKRLGPIQAVDIKRTQWRRLLSKVYGSDIASDDLFVRHTFLNQFAKLLAYAALKGIPHSDSTLAEIVTGEAFHSFGVGNIGEIDFFAWVLDDPDVQQEAVAMLKRLAQSLVVYDLTRVDEDLLKQLYQNLVDPETRHDLGEFYTPDWLAELTLREIAYKPGQSLLDPSCGSGTFLFTAIRRLAEQGLTGWKLVEFALENVAGMDVHPLAVTIARINYLLAIIPHMHGQRTGAMRLGLLPVYMADALQTPEEKGTQKGTLIVAVDHARDERFHIPEDAARAPAVFADVINQMDEYARQPTEQLNMGLRNSFAKLVQSRFGAVQQGIGELSVSYWTQNLSLLNRLIHEGRNSIWAYVLKNQARPLLLSAQKFDVIVGNPPWLSYRYIKDKTYQAEVKMLYQRYGLIGTGDVKLFTQMDLSTLMMAHCEAMYLKPGGLIAFVMPRSVITGAKQHRPFQARGLTRVLDLLGVHPLFNVPTAVLIKQLGQTVKNAIPTSSYSGRLPKHELSFAEAQGHLASTAAQTQFVGAVKIASPHYYDKFKQGATLVPRNLCFVKPEQEVASGDTAFNPSMITDPDMDSEAKRPWKGIQIRGKVYEQNLYATLLSKNLVPFGYRKLHLVALPIKVGNDSELQPMNEFDFLSEGHADSWRTWFATAEKYWDDQKKNTSQFETLLERYNYQRTLTAQNSKSSCRILYNGNGVHLAACVIETNAEPLKVYGYPTQTFVIDHKTYYLDLGNVDEAHYLAAMLNAPYVDKAIKAYQSRGKGVVGERDIHRTPFEACAIPAFDAKNADHRELARLSQDAHRRVAATALTGQVVKARSQARAAVEDLIGQIDVIARRVLGMAESAVVGDEGEEDAPGVR